MSLMATSAAWLRIQLELAGRRELRVSRHYVLVGGDLVRAAWGPSPDTPKAGGDSGLIAGLTDSDRPAKPWLPRRCIGAERGVDAGGNLAPPHRQRRARGRA